MEAGRAVLLDHVDEPSRAAALLATCRFRRDPEPAFPPVFRERHLPACSADGRALEAPATGALPVCRRLRHE